MTRPVRQTDKGVAPAGRVQVGSADARHERADQGFVRARGWNVRCLDGDPAWVNDDASHAGQGDFLSRPAVRLAVDSVAWWSRSVKVFLGNFESGDYVPELRVAFPVEIGQRRIRFGHQPGGRSERPFYISQTDQAGGVGSQQGRAPA